MNNELFDRMIKDNLQEMQVVPSAGVKKVLGWKLFFQNMIVFHKVKVAVGLLLVSGASTYYFVNADNGQDDLLNTGSFVSHFGLPDNSTFELLAEEELSNELIIKLEDESLTITNEINDPKEFGDNKGSLESIQHENNGSMETTTNVEPKSNGTLFAAEKKGTDTEQLDNKDKILTNDKKSKNVELPEVEQKSGNIPGGLSISNQEVPTKHELTAVTFKADGNKAVIESSIGLTVPNNNCEPIPFLTNDRAVFGEWSFDLYKGMVGQSEIASDLKSAIHRKYYWDFHGETDVLKMNMLGGANVSYSFGARMFRLKATAGVSYFSVNDTKAVYEFEEITDPAWLNFFNTDELAWVNTYGEDTCTQCFYAHSTEELKEELEKEYNQYSYLRIPLQLGTQLNFKYASLDLLGGVDMNFLTKSKGLYVKEGLEENYERFYYWEDLQISTLSKGNEMLKKSFMTWSLAANLRIRVTKRFDVLAGYQINKSFGNITNDSYLMRKSLKSSNMTVGLTFYPNARTVINPKF